MSAGGSGRVAAGEIDVVAPAPVMIERRAAPAFLDGGIILTYNYT